MWRWFLVVAGCGATSRDAALNNEQPGAGTVIVRMAREGEIPAPPTEPDQLGVRFAPDCELAGEGAREQVPAVLAFARTQLLAKESRAVHTRLILPGAPEPPSSKGIEVTITPRTKVGQLQVADWWQGGGAATLYCLYVRHEGGNTVIVVQSLWSVISDKPPAWPTPSPRACSSIASTSRRSKNAFTSSRIR